MVVDATIGLPAFELRAAETVPAVPPEAALLDSSMGTSNDGFRIVSPANGFARSTRHCSGCWGGSD